MAIVKDIYIGTSSGPKRVKAAYVGGSDGKPHIFYKILGYNININDNYPTGFANATDLQVISMLNDHYATKLDIGDYWAVGQIRQASSLANRFLFQIATHKYYITDIESTGLVPEQTNPTWRIIGINHDSLKTTGNRTKAAITIQMSGTISSSQATLPINMKMNFTATNTDGWKTTIMRKYLDGGYGSQDSSQDGLFYNSCRFRSLIRKVKKWTYNKNGGIDTTYDHIFLVSQEEVFGGDASIEKYSYYQTSTNRKKYIGWAGTGSSSTVWWLRSPNYTRTTTFYCVDNNGLESYSEASTDKAVSPACCL